MPGADGRHAPPAAMRQLLRLCPSGVQAAVSPGVQHDAPAAPEDAPPLLEYPAAPPPALLPPALLLPVLPVPPRPVLLPPVPPVLLPPVLLPLAPAGELPPVDVPLAAGIPATPAEGSGEVSLPPQAPPPSAIGMTDATASPSIQRGHPPSAMALFYVVAQLRATEGGAAIDAPARAFRQKFHGHCSSERIGHAALAFAGSH
jgi:hypothetical protein